MHSGSYEGYTLTRPSLIMSSGSNKLEIASRMSNGRDARLWTTAGRCTLGGSPIIERAGLLSPIRRQPRGTLRAFMLELPSKAMSDIIQMGGG